MESSKPLTTELENVMHVNSKNQTLLLSSFLSLALLISVHFTFLISYCRRVNHVFDPVPHFRMTNLTSAPSGKPDSATGGGS